MTTTETKPSAGTAAETKPRKAVKGGVEWLDDRLGMAKGGRVFLDKIFPDHWSFLLGEIALYSFVVLIATGIFLSLYFVPSATEHIYTGSYAPLRGHMISESLESTLNISFNVRSGLVIRQMHHWAADVFLGSICVHMFRIFFTGAFRKPRELNWIVGTTLLTLGILEGFLGYSLPDDLISGTGIRIAFSILESIPLVGTYLASLVFGGQFPGNGIIIPRFFLIHILIMPLLLFALIGVHLGLLVRQKHTQFKGKGRTENNVVGSPMFPTFMLKTTGFLFMVAGVLWLLGGLVQINPVWQFGQYEPYKISYAVQPDWYMGWLDGALRIWPSWEFSSFGHTIPFMVFLPGALVPGLTFGLFYAWPFLEAWLSRDKEAHNLLDRPRDKPRRTAFGAALVAFYFMLFAASSTDVLAKFFGVSLNTVLNFFRVSVPVTPLIAGWLAYRICKEMAAADGSGKRKRAVVVTRSASGEYTTNRAEVRPGDEGHELEPIPVPVYIDLGRADLVTGDGVRRVAR